MNKCEIIVTDYFEEQYQKLSKKYPLLTNQLTVFQQQLKENPMSGVSLGAKLFKIRLANKDKNRGKRSGFRIITYHLHQSNDVLEIYLITIYDKS